MTVDELEVLITANTNALRKEINKTNSVIAGLTKSASKTQNGVTSAFKKLKTGIVALGIGKIIKDSIQSGMDAIESDSLFETSLGNLADDVRSWSDEISNALGLSAVAMRKNTGVIYNMTTSMGLAEDNALKMSKGITLLAEDMASFYNLDSAEAFNKLRAGITGETEPLKALGILVDENTIKQVAYSEGIARNGAELTQQQKVLARYVAILRQTGNAQGDLARTIDSPSNQLRLLKNQVSSLGLAFSNFLIPVVSAVLPYITAFTKVVTQGVTALAKLLGLVGGSGGTGEAVQSISDGVGGISSGLDKANNSAKKLKGTLAGFDEMNVLRDNSADSSGAGGAGVTSAGIDFDLGDYDAHLELLNSKTDVIVEKIKTAFSSIGEGIDFDNLINSMSNLKQAVEPLTSTLFEGLKWAYDNVLVPLAQWSINDLIPAFLNAISGALTLLNPVLESFMSLGGWLWNSFLEPIASWTGGIIVDTLNGVGDALGTIGNWASSNQKTIDNMVTAFATFFGLWKLTELMAFIQMSGGLIGAITGITTAIWGTVTAKLVDKAETIALTLMYAKDFLASILQGTVAIGKQIIQWGLLAGAKALDAIKTGIVTTAQTLWNVCSGVGTALTTALGVAFNVLCSPITLVILAIGALVAVGVLLYKNWDTIMAWAGKLGSKLKSVFESIGNKCNEIFKGIAQTFKNIINTITGGINVLIRGINKIKFNIPDWVPAIGGKSLGFNIPEIPKLARGGIVDRPTYAMIGEAGKEAVMPLERNTGWIDQLASKINNKMGGSDTPIQLTIKLGEDTIFDKFIDNIKSRNFESNGEVFVY